MLNCNEMSHAAPASLMTFMIWHTGGQRTTASAWPQTYQQHCCRTQLPSVSPMLQVCMHHGTIIASKQHAFPCLQLMDWDTARQLCQMASTWCSCQCASMTSHVQCYTEVLLTNRSVCHADVLLTHRSGASASNGSPSTSARPSPRPDWTFSPRVNVSPRKGAQASPRSKVQYGAWYLPANKFDRATHVNLEDSR